MNIFKRILIYLFWTLIALMSGIAYMRIVLGAPSKPSTGIMQLFDWVYGYVLIYVGSIIGIIIAFIYILMDICYFNKRLEQLPYAILFRFLIILIITIVVGTTHYMLEKVINVI